MAQQVRSAPTRARHACSGECAVDDHGDRAMRPERVERSTGADEDRVGGGLRPTRLEVRDQCLAHLLGDWQSRLAASLAADSNPGAFPIKVTQPKLHDVPGAKAQASEQKENRSVTRADRRPEIARRNEAFDVFCGQVARQ